ncbi:hypothetical protein [Kitasatospora indigofera]|uniref:hypothetical protein n=1 Tax=Kitasatospora indigofera TaxID=67307 RepID=UPI00339E7342
MSDVGQGYTLSGAQPSAGAVSVTPDVIVKIAGLLREATKPMDRAEPLLASVTDLRPGEFPDGDDLRKFVGSGRDGRIRNIMENNARVRDQLQKVADKLEEVARRYTSADELNKHFLEEMAPLFGSQPGLFGGADVSNPPTVDGSKVDLPKAGTSGETGLTEETPAA